MLNPRETSEAVDVCEPPQRDAPPPPPLPEILIRDEPACDVERRAQGLKDCATGAILVSIGLAFGGSVFLGNPGPLDWLFDSLGTFWIAKGLWQIYSA